MFIHYIADYNENYKMLRWLMGGLDVIGFKSIKNIFPFWLLGTVLILIKARDLDQLSFGAFLAHSRGVNVARSQKICYFASSIAVSSTVCLTGPIGFVGLIIPHILRFIIGPSYIYLMPASIFAGAGFLILCDTFARVIFSPIEIPVGVLTAMIGGPFFIILLFKEKKKYSFEN